MKILTEEEYQNTFEIIKKLEKLSGLEIWKWGKRTTEKQFDTLQQIGYSKEYSVSNYGKNNTLLTWFLIQQELINNEDSKRNVLHGHPYYGIYKNGRPSNNPIN